MESHNRRLYLTTTGYISDVYIWCTMGFSSTRSDHMKVGPKKSLFSTELKSKAAMSFFDIFPTFQEAPWSYVVVPIILVSSIRGFRHKPHFHALLLHPYEVSRGKRLHTLLTSAFIHRNWLHLIFNLIVVFGLGYDMFGMLEQEYGTAATWILTPVLFILLTVVPNLAQTWAKRNDFQFTSIGASGLSSALFGFSFLFFPLEKIRHLVIPFITNSGEYWLYVLVVTILFTFNKRSTINRPLHVMGYLLGSISAIIIRQDSIPEFFRALGLL